MARKRTRMYHLPEGEYSDGFLRYLAMAIHVDLLEPEELTFHLENGTTIDQIGFELKKRITKYAKSNSASR